MKKFYSFVLILTLVAGISHIARAQKVNMKDGPLKEADWLKNPGEAALNESHAGEKTWITKWYGPKATTRTTERSKSLRGGTSSTKALTAN